MTEWVRFALSAALMLAGLGVTAVSITGVFRFRFVLNRMHCAGIIDTLGVLLMAASLMLASGAPVYCWKLAAVVAFLGLGSPLSSHLIARMELMTDETAGEHMDIETEEEEPDELR